MSKDTIRLMDVYKKFLEGTGGLVEVVERHYEKNAGEVSEELRKKQREFQEHSYNILEKINDDLHELLRINYELKNLEDTEMAEEEKK